MIFSLVEVFFVVCVLSVSIGWKYVYLYVEVLLDYICCFVFIVDLNMF